MLKQRLLETPPERVPAALVETVKAFCEPIDVTQYPPEAADDRAFVLELSERVRSTIQERLRANLLTRRTPFW